jgi:hypothetical protein
LLPSTLRTLNLALLSPPTIVITGLQLIIEYLVEYSN